MKNRGCKEQDPFKNNPPSENISFLLSDSFLYFYSSSFWCETVRFENVLTSALLCALKLHTPSIPFKSSTQSCFIL